MRIIFCVLTFPKVIVPRHISLTLRLVLGSVVYFIDKVLLIPALSKRHSFNINYGENRLTIWRSRLSFGSKDYLQFTSILCFSFVTRSIDKSIGAYSQTKHKDKKAVQIIFWYAGRFSVKIETIAVATFCRKVPV